MAVRLIVAPECMTMPVMFIPRMSFISPTSSERAHRRFLK